MPQKITNRTEELFNEALAQPPENRSGFLAQACGTDTGLLRTVQELLNAYEAVKTAGLRSGSGFDVVPPGINPEVLQALGERYDDIRLVGMGGMGFVFRALDREIKQVVALKILHPSLADNERAAERFRSEIRLAREITHKNVCRTYDWHRLGGALVISMEFVEGETLRAVLDRIKGVAVPQGLSWSGEICDALTAAHHHRIVHRDLKPENIMIDLEGQIKVMDFGIARSLDLTSEEEREKPGTPSYMSPEQKSGKEVGPTSDIYSLGLVLYELFTGVRREPGSGIPAASVNRYLPAHINDAIGRCLEPDPNDRFQSTSELKTALFNDHANGRGRQTAGLHRASRRLAILAASSTIVAVGLLFLLRQPPQPPPQDKINALEFSPDGRLLASGSEDATVILWDATTQGRIKTLVNHVRAVTALAFSADSRWLASGGSDNTIKVSEVASGRERATLPETKEIVALALSPDGRWLASTTDETVKLWDVSTGRVVQRMSHNDAVQDLAFDPSGRLLASASTDRTVRVWEVETGRRLAEPLRHDDLVQAVAFSPDGRLLASGSSDKTIKLWSTATWDTVRTLWQDERVWGVWFSSDGTTLFSVSDRGNVKVWRAPTWRMVAGFPSKERIPDAVWAVSSDGRSLAIGTDDGRVVMQKLPNPPTR